MHEKLLKHGDMLTWGDVTLRFGSVYWHDGWCLFSASLDDARQKLTLNGRTPASWQPLRDGDLIESGQWLRINFRT